MALSSATLSAAIRSKLLASGAGAVDGSELTDFCDAIAEAVVEHVTANAVVGPGTFEAGGDPVTGAGVVS